MGLTMETERKKLPKDTLEQQKRLCEVIICAESEPLETDNNTFWFVKVYTSVRLLHLFRANTKFVFFLPDGCLLHPL